MDWETDDGLRLRIAGALALVVALPFAFVYTMLFLTNTVGLWLLEYYTNQPWNGSFYVEPLSIAAVVVVAFALQFALGDRVALRSAGAVPASAERYPDLHAATNRLAAQVDLPPPDLAVVYTDVPNAFTVGRSPDSATVVVTTGLLDALEGDELDAVLAHELAHVRNRDMAVMTTTLLLPTVTVVVAMVAYRIMAVASYLTPRHSDEDNPMARLVLVVMASAGLTALVSAAFWVGSYLVHRILSQYREYAADRGAARITGEPAALASALRTLDDELAAAPDEDLREQDGGHEALYVAPIESNQFAESHELISGDLFPATHPPTEERIDRLRVMVEEEL